MITALDIDTFARTLWGEARGEVFEGILAVGWVIMNRYNRPGWWSRNKGDGIPDDTIAATCRDPMQFSCWNENDPNREKLINVTLDDSAFQKCYYIALRLSLEYEKNDPTHGSCHYHTANVMPKWAQGKIPVYTIGDHRFYNNVN